MIRVAVLDDNSSDLFLFKKLVESEDTQVDTYKDCDHFLHNFNHDIAVIDINLGCENHNGFDIANEIKSRFKVPVLMISSCIPENEECEAFLPKTKISKNQILNRFNALKDENVYNLMQLTLNRSHFEPQRQLTI